MKGITLKFLGSAEMWTNERSSPINFQFIKQTDTKCEVARALYHNKLPALIHLITMLNCPWSLWLYELNDEYKDVFCTVHPLTARCANLNFITALSVQIMKWNYKCEMACQAITDSDLTQSNAMWVFINCLSKWLQLLQVQLGTPSYGLNYNREAFGQHGIGSLQKCSTEMND